MIGIWDDLVQAYYDKNRYGGDTAEIYFYRIKSDYIHGSLREFVELLKYFENKYECQILIEDEPIDSWNVEEFHRVHVRVVK